MSASTIYGRVEILTHLPECSGICVEQAAAHI